MSNGLPPPPTWLLIVMLIPRMMAAAQQPYNPPPTAQDCLGAIPVCQPVYTTTQSYTGHGNVYPEIVAGNACPLCMAGEINDVFYVITTQTAGFLRFTLTPANPNNDYDWSLFNMTNANCSELYSKAAQLQVSCNSYGTGGVNGPTGINSLLSNNQNCCGPGTGNGPAFNKDVNVSAGQTYLLNISNWSSVGQAGYTLDFSGSTAQIFDNVPPEIDSIQGAVTCEGADSLYIRFSENIKCSDLQNHPEKFSLTSSNGTYSITNVYSKDCSLGAPQSFGAKLLISPALTTGSYVLHIVGDISDLCSNVALYNDYPFQITNNNAPVLSFVNNSPSVCSADSTNIALSATPFSAISWTSSCPSPDVSGFGSGTGNLIHDHPVNNGSLPAIVTYHAIATLNACVSPVADVSVTVNPVPHLVNTPDSSQICSPGFTTVSLQSDVTAAGFTWTATGNSNVTGYSAGTGSTIHQFLTNIVYSPQPVVYHITPSANACTGPVFIHTVRVFHKPDANFTPASQSICSGDTTSVSISSNVNGTAFTWAAGSTSGLVNGYSDGSGNIISQSITNTGNTPATVIYSVTPSADGCPPGEPVPLLITVNPVPVITNSQTVYQVCSGSSVTIPLQSNLPLPSYSWTANVSSSDVTGYSAGTGSTISQQLYNSGYASESVTYTVSPATGSCAGMPKDFLVTVNPLPDVYFNPAGQQLCSGSTTLINNLSHVSGASFSWTASGSSPSLSGFGPGSGASIQQTLLNVSVSSQTATYTVTPLANSCTGISQPAVVNVFNNPSVTFRPCFDTITTLNSRPAILTGASPRGGTYSGSGIASGEFNPSAAGVGTHNISYTYINVNGCSSTAHSKIHVSASGTFNCGNIFTDIRDSHAYPTVRIGSQCWMAANLNTGDYINSNRAQSDNCITEKYCFNDLSASCLQSGGYYQWDEIMQYSDTEGSKGICPPAWHIPSETEWNSLFAFVGGQGLAVIPLIEGAFSSFNVRMYGANLNPGWWALFNFSTFYWSSTPAGHWKAWSHGLNNPDPSISSYPSVRSNAFSVRCVKD